MIPKWIARSLLPLFVGGFLLVGAGYLPAAPAPLPEFLTNGGSETVPGIWFVAAGFLTRLKRRDPSLSEQAKVRERVEERINILSAYGEDETLQVADAVSGVSPFIKDDERAVGAERGLSDDHSPERIPRPRIQTLVEDLSGLVRSLRADEVLAFREIQSLAARGRQVVADLEATILAVQEHLTNLRDLFDDILELTAAHEPAADTDREQPLADQPEEQGDRRVSDAFRPYLIVNK